MSVQLRKKTCAGGSPRERVQAIIKLMEFVLSKQNKHEIENTPIISGFNIIIPEGYTDKD